MTRIKEVEKRRIRKISRFFGLKAGSAALVAMKQWKLELDCSFHVALPSKLNPVPPNERSVPSAPQTDTSRGEKTL